MSVEESQEVIEVKKRKKYMEIPVLTSQKTAVAMTAGVEDQVDCCTNMPVYELIGQQQREDSNGKVKGNSAETTPVNMSSSSDGAHSSGFGDDEIPVDDDEDGLRNGTDNDEAPDQSIFETDNLTFEDRLNAYADILKRGICQNDSRRDVHTSIFDFLNETLHHGGWRALWKVNNDCDVLVEVDSAPYPASNHQHPSALVHLLEPLHCVVDGEPCVGKDLEAYEKHIRRILETEDGVVEVIDLYPIFVKTGVLDDTALAIEHARFFYQNLWRPMDEEDDSCSTGCAFMDKHLKQRLKFIYDVKEKHVPAHIARKHECALAECVEKYERLTAMQEQLGLNDSTDGEAGLLDMNESLVAVDIMGLADAVEVLKMKLEKLENPLLRSLLDLPTGFSSEKRNEGKSKRQDNSPTTFIVSPVLTAGMIQNLHPDVVIEHCHRPGAAMMRCYDGDTILVFPGTYSGENFYNLDQSVTIKGIGQKEDIIIRCEDVADIFVDCVAQSATISNLTLEDENIATGDGLVAVHAGSKLTLDGCVLRNGGTGVSVFRGGTLEMTGCEIKHIKKNGVRCKAGSAVQISDSEIHQCALTQYREKIDDVSVDDDGIKLIGGIAVEVDGSDEDCDRAALGITGTKIHDVYGAGIAVFVSSREKDDPEPITADVIGLVTGLEVRGDIKGNEIRDNMLGEAMLAKVCLD